MCVCFYQRQLPGDDKLKCKKTERKNQRHEHFVTSISPRRDEFNDKGHSGSESFNMRLNKTVNFKSNNQHHFLGCYTLSSKMCKEIIVIVSASHERDKM